jgi:UDP:flavonoid glycosyltransferase YjiC (YdhE family)
MFGVLAHGLPSVALPQSADNFINASLLAGTGAAHTLMPGEVTGPAVRAALRTVLGIGTYRQRARKLAEEIAAMPSADDVAAELRF